MEKAETIRDDRTTSGNAYEIRLIFPAFVYEHQRQ